MTQPLTKRQRQIYEWLGDQIKANGFAPSLQEIATHFELSSLATVHKHLTNLAERGYIARRWNRSRYMELLWNSECCPTCGRALPTTARAELAEAV